MIETFGRSVYLSRLPALACFAALTRLARRAFGPKDSTTLLANLMGEIDFCSTVLTASFSRTAPNQHCGRTSSGGASQARVAMPSWAFLLWCFWQPAAIACNQRIGTSAGPMPLDR